MNLTFLLAHSIGYHPVKGELTIDTEIILLQDLENKLLSLFVEHQGEILTKDKIFAECWPGRIGSDNALNRAISTLRTKLKDNSRSPIFIKTLPKVGYQFIASVTPINNKIKNNKKEPFTILKTFYPRHWIFLAASILLILLSLIIIFVPTEDKAQYLAQQSIRMTNLSGEEINPFLSQDGQYLLFSHRETVTSFYQIFLKSTAQEQLIQLTHSPMHHFQPKLNTKKNKLLYIATKNDQCEVHLMTLSAQFMVIEDKKILNCMHGENTGISWGKTDQYFFYTMTESNNAPHNIYYYDITQQRATRVNTATPKMGKGFYYLEYYPKQQRLLALSNEIQTNTEIIIFNDDFQIITRKSISQPLRSAALLDQGIVYRTEQNHFQYWQNVDDAYRLLSSPLQPIFSPYLVNNKEPQLVFVAGDLVNHNLVKTNLSSQQKDLLLDGNFVSQHPVVGKQSGAIYFISDKTGINQVWKLVAGVLYSVTQFDKNIYITGLAVSADEKTIAINHNDLINFYSMDSLINEITPVVQIENAYNPFFYQDNEHVVVTRVHQGQYSLSIFNIKLDQYIDVYVDDAALGFVTNNLKKIFFFKYSEGGLWQWDSATQEVRLIDLSINAKNINEIAVRHRSLFFKGVNNHLTRLELLTRKKQQLPIKLGHSFTILSDESAVVMGIEKQGNTDIFLTKY